MNQAVMTSPGKIEFRSIEIPAINDDQVLVKIRRIGVCGSDIHVYHGLHPYTSYPVVQGHEVSGSVAGWGKAVKGFSMGEKVTFMPQVTCGICYPCRHGMYHICDSLKVMGFQTDGAGQEYFPVAVEMVLKLPETMSLDDAAMIEPTSVAVHALRRGGDVEGKNVLVMGSGTIGNLVGQVARASGALQVLMADINEFKLQKARECGLLNTVNPHKYDLSKAILETFGPDKADLILVCVGVEDTMTQAIANARKGTTIVVVGVFGKKPVVDLGLVQDRELNLVGTLMYQKKDYEIAIDFINAGKIHLKPMVSLHIPFQQYLDAYKKIEEAHGDIMKVMIDL
jgi:L-iditol 2-dehydrogenase